jgi:hypothetical protein
MRAYRCKKRFFCQPLKRYVPQGAVFGRYENVVKLVMNDNPVSDVDPFNQLVDGFVYVNPDEVTWIYALEPPPLGTRNDYFTDIAAKDEDEFGNVGATSDGLPSNSQLRIATDGTMYLQNATTSLWHPLRANGPDGSVYLELGQNGVPSVP